MLSINKLIYLGSVGLIILLVVGFFVYANNLSIVPASSDRLTIATTIFPLADIAREISGEQARVIQLLPTGTDPHAYSITPQQVAAMQQAKIIFVIGYGLDDWAVRSATNVSKAKIVRVDQNISLRRFGEQNKSGEGVDNVSSQEQGSVDPHYWLSVPNAQKIAANIAAALQEIDPENQSVYADNLSRYVKELDVLEQELQVKASQAPKKEFIAIHDAWLYLVDQYGFNLLATYEPVEGKTPSINEINQLQELVLEHNIDTFFTEPVKESIAATRFLTEELGLKIRILDDIGGIGSRDSYINLMRENIRALTTID